MSARNQKRTLGADIRPYTVAAANTVRHGAPVKLSSGEIVEATGIGDNVIGIAYEQLTNVPQSTAFNNIGWTAPAGSRVAVMHLGAGICPVLVGVGGITAGLPVRTVLTTGGAIDATIGGGTTKITVLGTAMETGAAGDLAGVNLATASYTVGS